MTTECFVLTKFGKVTVEEWAVLIPEHKTKTKVNIVRKVTNVSAFIKVMNDCTRLQYTRQLLITF